MRDGLRRDDRLVPLFFFLEKIDVGRQNKTNAVYSIDRLSASLTLCLSHTLATSFRALVVGVAVVRRREVVRRAAAAVMIESRAAAETRDRVRIRTCAATGTDSGGNGGGVTATAIRRAARARVERAVMMRCASQLNVECRSLVVGST